MACLSLVIFDVGPADPPQTCRHAHLSAASWCLAVKSVGMPLLLRAFLSVRPHVTWGQPRGRDCLAVLLELARKLLAKSRTLLAYFQIASK